MTEVSQTSLEEALLMSSHPRIHRRQHDHESDVPEDVRKEGGRLFNCEFCQMLLYT